MPDGTLWERLTSWAVLEDHSGEDVSATFIVIGILVVALLSIVSVRRMYRARLWEQTKENGRLQTRVEELERQLNLTTQQLRDVRAAQIQAQSQSQAQVQAQRSQSPQGVMGSAGSAVNLNEVMSRHIGAQLRRFEESFGNVGISNLTEGIRRDFDAFMRDAQQSLSGEFWDQTEQESTIYRSQIVRSTAINHGQAMTIDVYVAPNINIDDARQFIERTLMRALRGEVDLAQALNDNNLRLIQAVNRQANTELAPPRVPAQVAPQEAPKEQPKEPEPAARSVYDRVLGDDVL